MRPTRHLRRVGFVQIRAHESQNFGKWIPNLAAFTQQSFVVGAVVVAMPPRLQSVRRYVQHLRNLRRSQEPFRPPRKRCHLADAVVRSCRLSHQILPDFVLRIWVDTGAVWEGCLVECCKEMSFLALPHNYLHHNYLRFITGEWGIFRLGGFPPVARNPRYLPM